MRPSQKENYYHLGNNGEVYSNAVIATSSAQSYATAVCNIESMALTNYAKVFGNATNFLVIYSLAINAMIEFNKLSDGYTYFV